MKKILLLALLGSFAAQAMNLSDAPTEQADINKPILVSIKNNTATDWTFSGKYLGKKQIFSIIIPAHSTRQIDRQLSFSKPSRRTFGKQQLYFLRQIDGPAKYRLVGINVLKLLYWTIYCGSAMGCKRSTISNELTIASNERFTIELSKDGQSHKEELKNYNAELKLLKEAKPLVDIAVNEMVDQIQKGKITLESLKAKLPTELFEQIKNALGK